MVRVCVCDYFKSIINSSDGWAQRCTTSVSKTLSVVRHSDRKLLEYYGQLRGVSLKNWKVYFRSCWSLTDGVKALLRCQPLWFSNFFLKPMLSLLSKYSGQVTLPFWPGWWPLSKQIGHRKNGVEHINRLLFLFFFFFDSIFIPSRPLSFFSSFPFYLPWITSSILSFFCIFPLVCMCMYWSTFLQF